MSTSQSELQSSSSPTKTDPQKSTTTYSNAYTSQSQSKKPSSNRSTKAMLDKIKKGITSDPKALLALSKNLDKASLDLFEQDQRETLKNYERDNQ